MRPRVTPELWAAERARTELGHVFIGANAVVIAGVNVRSGAVVGAGVLTADVELWTVNVGCLCRPISRRASKNVLECARSLGVEDPA